MIFYCESLETLSECIHAVLALIYPFRWQHIFVPVLPESLINYLGAPMPFIIGIKSHLAHCQTDFTISEVVLVNLDKGTVQSTAELQNKLRTLPADPAWKLKRELKRNLKKMALAMQTHDDYRHKYGNYNPQTFARPNFKRNIEDGARGWDDLAFYDAFLAFFVLFVGDWRNFYDENNKLTPKPPYHLSWNEADHQDDDSQNSLRQSTTAQSSTPPLEDSLTSNREETYEQTPGFGPLSSNDGQTETMGTTTPRDEAPSVDPQHVKGGKKFKIKHLKKAVQKAGGTLLCQERMPCSVCSH